MSCKYADGTEMKVGDTVQYETLDMEHYSRGYGISYETKKSKIVEFKVVLANGDMESPKKLIKQTGGKRRSVTRKRRE
jgi:hypothetical protein